MNSLLRWQFKFHQISTNYLNVVSLNSNKKNCRFIQYETVYIPIIRRKKNLKEEWAIHVADNFVVFSYVRCLFHAYFPSVERLFWFTESRTHVMAYVCAFNRMFGFFSSLIFFLKKYHETGDDFAKKTDIHFIFFWCCYLYLFFGLSI